MSYMQISDMMQEVNIIGGKVSVVSVNGAWESGGCSETPAEVLGGEALQENV